MSLSRRDWLRLAGPAAAFVTAATAGAPIASAFEPSAGERFAFEPDGFPAYRHEGPLGPEGTFRHGVASGDPLVDRVILWTRVTVPGRPVVPVLWEIATDEAFRERVGAGWDVAVADSDFTVKIDVPGLRPGRVYHYRFRCLGRTSDVGRTRTLPVGRVERARFALCCCSAYGSGYFAGYRLLAERDDLDAVLHVGDYIYEYGRAAGATERLVDPPGECHTLEDYRRRYACHRLDPELQRAHRTHPFVVIWDDHEIANDGFRDGAENHQPDEGLWALRKASAQQAHREWMPIREPAFGRIYRRFAYGDLCDLLMLDTRFLARDRQPTGWSDHETIVDPTRTMLGAEQERWLEHELETAGPLFRLVTQQVMMAPLMRVGAPRSQGGGIPLRVDGWDGYVAARARLLDTFRDRAKGDVVVLSGDLHASFVGELPLDPFEPTSYEPGSGRGSVAVEFVAPGLTSPPVLPTDALPFILSENPHLRWGEIGGRGYVVVDVDRDRVQGAFFRIDDVWRADSGETFLAAFSTSRGTHRLKRDPAPAAQRAEV
ncbi:MAG: alkaline phosphatase D family protein [Polyangiales bacterium]